MPRRVGPPEPRCNNLPVLAWKIDGLLDDPARLARRRDNGRRLARPNGAREIAGMLLGGIAVRR